MQSQSNVPNIRLSDLSEPTRQKLQSAGFDLSKGINEFQNIPTLFKYERNPTVFYNALFYSIFKNDLNMLKELLDAKVDLNCPVEKQGPNCLMYAMAYDCYEAFEFILKHPHSQIIDFNYCLADGEWTDGCLADGPLLMSGIRKEFVYDPEDKNNMRWLSKIMENKQLDFNLKVQSEWMIGKVTETALTYLFFAFGSLNSYSPRLFPYFKDVAEKLIAGGADLNNHDISLEYKMQSPMGNLFCMEQYEQLDDEAPFNARRRENFLTILNLLLNQLEDVSLNRKALGDQESCLSVAMDFQLDNVINKLLSEIRIQALKKILLFKNKQESQTDTKENNQTLEKELKAFIDGHALEDENDAHQLLDEKVTPFVLSMMKPKKSLGEIVYSPKIRKQLEMDGFDLNADFKQISKNNSHQTDLLNYAALQGLKGLVVGLVLQPSFLNDYNSNQIFDALIASIYQRHLGVVQVLAPILFSTIKDSTKEFPMLKNALSEAAKAKNPRLMKYFVELYKNLGGPKYFGAKLLADEKSKNWLNSALQFNDSTYMIDQVRHLFLHQGFDFAPNKKYPLATRLQEFYKSHFKESSVPAYIMDVISPIVRSFKYQGKIIFQAKFCLDLNTYNSIHTPPSDRPMKRTVNLPSDAIFNILSFLEEKELKNCNFNIVKKEAAKSVCSWFPTYAVKRKLELKDANPAPMESLEHKTNNTGKRKAETDIDNEQPEKRARVTSSSQSLFASSSSSSNNAANSTSNNTQQAAVPMDQSDALAKTINGMSK